MAQVHNTQHSVCEHATAMSLSEHACSEISTLSHRALAVYGTARASPRRPGSGGRRRAPVYAPRGVVEKCNVILQNCPERAVARDFGVRDPHRTRTSPRIARPFDSRSPPSSAFRRSPGVKIVFVSVGGGRAARPKRHPSPTVASRHVLPPRRDASSSPLTVLSTSMPSRRVSSVFTPSRA